MKKPKSGEDEPDEALRFSSLLIPIDLTPISDRVLGRSALLPLADGARITLLHVVRDDLPAAARNRAERDAKKYLENEASHLAARLPAGADIEPLVRTGNSAVEIAASARAAKAEIIVMGRGGGRALRDAFLGSTAERVVRHGRLPVLAVRQAPRAAYRRPAVAVDFELSPTDVLALMLRIVPPPRPHITVIHAFDSPYERIAYPSLSEEDAEDWRHELEAKATRQIAKLCRDSMAKAGLRARNAPLYKPHVQCGSPRLVIPSVVKKAEVDLLALGTRGYSGITHALLGTVAGDVLRDVACDVLLVPGPR